MTLAPVLASEAERCQRVEQAISYTFVDRRVLLEALTHGSWRAEHNDGVRDYQRLEFLGDALLNAAIVARLYALAPEASEGELTRARASLVSEQGIAKVARELGVGDWVRLGEGEERNDGRGRASLLADVFEAVVGAIGVDGGFEAAAVFVGRVYAAALPTALSRVGRADYKSTLQEALQAVFGERPSYNSLGSNGPPHALVFHARVSFRGREIGRGRGRNKQAAEQEAAQAALQALTEGGGVAKTLGTAESDSGKMPDRASRDGEVE